MGGHSHWATTKRHKASVDAKRGKIFTKIIREITIAAKNGLPEPDANPRLRAAIAAARDVNMPSDTIKRAIKRGSGEEGSENYQEIRYEGFGPGGVAIIVEALTDNRNRTASEIRAAFTKYGGTLVQGRAVDPVGLDPHTDLASMDIFVKMYSNLYFLTARCRMASSQALPDPELYQGGLLVLGQVQQLQLSLNALYLDTAAVRQLVAENDWATDRYFRHSSVELLRSVTRVQDSVFSVYNAGYEFAMRSR